MRPGNALHLDYLYIISNFRFKCVGLLPVNAFCVIHPTPHALETGRDECVFVYVCANKKVEEVQTQLILFLRVRARVVRMIRGVRRAYKSLVKCLGLITWPESCWCEVPPFQNMISKQSLKKKKEKSQVSFSDYTIIIWCLWYFWILIDQTLGFVHQSFSKVECFRGPEMKCPAKFTEVLLFFFFCTCIYGSLWFTYSDANTSRREAKNNKMAGD